MNCPICHHSLVAMKFQYLPFWACRQCQGIWVEAKMLRHLATRLAAENDIKPHRPMGTARKIVKPISKDEPMRLCPQCQAGMKKVNYAYDSNVFVDRCDACNALWLDKGEIEQLAACHQIDEKAELLGRELAKESNDAEESQYVQIIIMAIYVLARFFLKF